MIYLWHLLVCIHVEISHCFIIWRFYFYAFPHLIRVMLKSIF